jgi:pyrrolidone-carboxylate peptidase
MSQKQFSPFQKTSANPSQYLIDSFSETFSENVITKAELPFLSLRNNVSIRHGKTIKNRDFRTDGRKPLVVALIEIC